MNPSHPSRARARGLSLVELLIVMAAVIAALAVVVSAGAAVHRQGQQDAVVTDVQRLASEIRRVYADHPTAYLALTAADLRAASSALEDLWTGTGFRAGDFQLTVAPANALPRGTVGAAGDAFSVAVTTEAALCRGLLRAFQAQANLASVSVGSTAITLPAGPTTYEASALSNACDRNSGALTVAWVFH